MRKRKTEEKKETKPRKRLIRNEEIPSPQISDESEPDDRHYKKHHEIIDFEKERRSKLDNWAVPRN